MLRLRGKRILVLEDEPLITMLLEEDLAAAGATVVATYNCRDALAAARSQRFDVATLDMRIGEGDCKEVAELLCQQGAPFIITSGDIHAPDFGAAARVDKPFSPEDVIAALLSVLPAAPSD